MDEYQLSTTHINREIQQEDVPFLALCFDNVEFYVDAMKLTPGEQSDVRLKRIESNHLAMIECLKIWKKRKLSQATFRVLLEMLVKLKKEAIADQVCQYLKVSACLYVKLLLAVFECHRVCQCAAYYILLCHPTLMPVINNSLMCTISRPLTLPPCTGAVRRCT